MSLANLSQAPRALKFLVLATVATFIIMFTLNVTLSTAQAPQGMVSFQLAANADQSMAILHSWGQEGLVWAMTSLWLDFPFAILYTVTLLLLTSYLLVDRPGVRERKTGNWVRALFVMAGLSDMGENVLLLNNLTDPTDGVSQAAAILAMVKFTGLFMGSAGLVLIRAARRYPISP